MGRGRPRKKVLPAKELLVPAPEPPETGTDGPAELPEAEGAVTAAEEPAEPEAEVELLPAEELERRMNDFFHGYFLIGARRDRASYYALSAEELKQYPRAFCGLFVNLIMDGQLDKAGELLERYEGYLIARMGMELVYPKLTVGRLLEIVRTLKAAGTKIPSIQISAGRPSLLNGVLDYTRLGPFLESRKAVIMDALYCMYEEAVVPSMYMLCLAEWYYQQNRLSEAERIVSRTVQDFDIAAQRRLLFAALYLQSKILLATGKTVRAESYIENIRRFVQTEGEQEFDYNLDAAEVYAAFYDGDFALISAWMKEHAPDEFSDFNMLDTYRYLIKIRCYILYRKHMAVVALVERLRPLLAEGNRFMDLCELDLLLAVSFFRSEEKELAFAAFERALRIARRRGYFRLLADEGAALMPVLVAYVKEKGESPYLMHLAEEMRNMAALYPLYLKPLHKNGLVFSQMEVNILRFMDQGKTKEEIAGMYFFSVDAVSFHLKNIYKKLEVSSAVPALFEARVLGLI